MVDDRTPMVPQKVMQGTNLDGGYVPAIKLSKILADANRRGSSGTKKVIGA